jgi:hypothetical protein
MVITIKPIVFGNFRKRTFRNPKAAERNTSIVVIRKRSILLLGLSQFEIALTKVIISQRWPWAKIYLNQTSGFR